jgi:(S)-2-hydroxyglutarate dehydrogenase
MQSTPNGPFDVVIVGAGIVGLATALRLLQGVPDLHLAIIDKEPGIAAHQSSHNSGVLHAGLYYRPGSLKARMCREGKAEMEQFAESHGIPVQRCGKLVVAVDEAERPRFDALRERAAANGVPGLEVLGPDEMREREPHVRGIAALWSPTSGIIDFVAVAAAMADDIRAAGGSIQTGCEVTAIEQRADEIVLQTGTGPLVTRNLVTCAGVQADRVARLSGERVPGSLVPFRGDYYSLSGDARPLVRGLIYPVPDTRFPFLGVHFSRRHDGAVWAGPNAVLAFAREGYRRRDVDLRDLAEVLTDRGFQRLAVRFWRTGAAEMVRDWSKRAFHARLARYVPELQLDDLRPGQSGVRAQLVRPDGSLVDDFVLGGSGRVLHVLSAPSPAATASLAIGAELAARALERFGIGPAT